MSCSSSNNNKSLEDNKNINSSSYNGDGLAKSNDPNKDDKSNNK